MSKLNKQSIEHGKKYLAIVENGELDEKKFEFLVLTRDNTESVVALMNPNSVQPDKIKKLLLLSDEEMYNSSFYEDEHLQELDESIVVYYIGINGIETCLGYPIDILNQLN